uniref:Uncharacterized protein n=1 Tax=Urocitellus parryii TaxID=9999 RepID=A0A8D2H9I6_UROPR
GTTILPLIHTLTTLILILSTLLFEDSSKASGFKRQDPENRKKTEGNNHWPRGETLTEHCLFAPIQKGLLWGKNVFLSSLYILDINALPGWFNIWKSINIIHTKDL